MKIVVLWIAMACIGLGAGGCKKKEPARQTAREQFKQKLAANRYRKPLLIFNNSKKTIKTIAMFYDDEGIVIRDLKPGAGIEEVMLTNMTSAMMQYFITFADNKQVVVPKTRWNFTPGTITGISIGDNGTITYK